MGCRFAHLSTSAVVVKASSNASELTPTPPSCKPSSGAHQYGGGLEAISLSETDIRG